MLLDDMEILREGDSRGHDRAVRFRFPSGLEVVGLATKNDYGGDWDYGPTWNYLVLADKPFLVDTGRWGMGKRLLQGMESCTGVSGKDLAFILLSHGHEDHDGGLCEIVEATGAVVRAHRIYQRLVRYYPNHAPADARRDFPASCWHCFMPDSFSRQHCLEYHQGRSRLEIEEVGDGHCILSAAVQTYHVPGHSPDALAVRLGEEAILVGDTVLPEITPFPSREAFFHQTRMALAPEYTRVHAVYGLRAYLRSLRKMMEIGNRFPGVVAFPAHRLFRDHHWNEINIEARAEEIIVHHIQRCADLLKILKQRPATAREMAVEYFPPSRLQGMGIFMGENEVLSHCELLSAAGDVLPEEGDRFAVTGSEHFESMVRGLSSRRDTLETLKGCTPRMRGFPDTEGR